MNSWIDTTSALSTSIRFNLKREIFPSSLVLRPHVSVFVWKGRFVLPVWSFVHTHPFLYQKEIFPSGLIFRPHVSAFVWMEIFSSGLVLRPHVSVFVWKGRFVPLVWSFVYRYPFLFQKEIFTSGLIFRPHVSVFVLRGRFFLSVWSFIHTYPFLFEKVDFSFRFGLSSTRIRFCLERETFRPVCPASTRLSGENVHQKRTFSKPLSRVEIFENAAGFAVFVWIDENGGFWKRLRQGVGCQ